MPATDIAQMTAGGARQAGETQCGQAHGHGPAWLHCAPSPMTDPTSIAPFLLVMIGGSLIMAGAQTAAGKGPGAWFVADPRSRRSMRRVQRQRRRLSSVFIGGGLLALVLILVPLMQDL
jgi:uncharacterized integral membrane protein